MRHRSLFLILFIGLAGLIIAASSTDTKSAAPDWAMNATIIEACSCPMFCQCYFNGEPAVHAGEHNMHAGHAHGQYCKFNMGYKINRGNYGAAKLDGAKFWVAGDLGAAFGKGTTEWAVVTFDPAVTKEQRDGIATILGKVYPVKWSSFAVGTDAPVSWKASKDMAVSTLDGGNAAEITLNRGPGMTSDPVVITNLRYFGAPRNDGFVLMPNKVEAYKLGDKAFEYRGTNGFMITIDINSKDVAPKSAGM